MSGVCARGDGGATGGKKGLGCAGVGVSRGCSGARQIWSARQAGAAVVSRRHCCIYCLSWARLGREPARCGSFCSPARRPGGPPPWTAGPKRGGHDSAHSSLSAGARRCPHPPTPRPPSAQRARQSPLPAGPDASTAKASPSPRRLPRPRAMCGAACLPAQWRDYAAPGALFQRRADHRHRLHGAAPEPSGPPRPNLERCHTRRPE